MRRTHVTVIFGLILALGPAMALAEPPSDPLFQRLGDEHEGFDLQALLGTFREGGSNASYQKLYVSEQSSCVYSLEFKKRRVAEDSDEFVMKLVEIEGRCPNAKGVTCAEVIPGISCDLSMSQTEELLKADSSVLRLESGSNMYNRTLDFSYKTSAGYVDVQLRFRANSKKGKVVKKKPTNMVAYRFK
ncbi:MAG: hypothetical protein GY716_20965 [bacterium]|nr:hypothetical protein [bacterium]